MFVKSKINVKLKLPAILIMSLNPKIEMAENVGLWSIACNQTVRSTV